MSDTNHNSKGPGFDYWSRRNYKGLEKPGRISKKITNKADRRKTKTKLKTKLKPKEDKGLDE